MILLTSYDCVGEICLIMKKISPICKAVFTLLFFVFSTIQAQEQVGIQLVSSTARSLELHFEAASYELVEVETPQGIMSIPQMEGASPMLVKGAPDLQKFATSYIIPKSGNVNVNLVNSTYRDYKVEVAPSKGNLLRNVIPSEMPYSFGDYYENDAFFPANIIEAQESYVLRDYDAQALWIYPFQYNPVTKVLRVYSSMDIEVDFEAEIVQPRSVDSQFDMIYDNLFINYNQNERYNQTLEDGGMLIIAYEEFIDPMSTFMDWKTQKGIENEIVDVATIGGADEIKEYVQEYYNTHNLTYVLLVGDHQHVPAYQASSGYSDNYYGYLEGDDSYPEVFVGRFSAESKEHVNTQVNRSLQYEMNPPSSDAYAECVGVGSAEGPGDDGEYDYEHLRNIRSVLLDYTYDTGHELYDGSQGGEDVSGNPSPNDLHVLLENGLGVINYTGHGSDFSCSSSGYSSSNVETLTNTEVHPFFWSVACVNGNFTGTTCFAETWLRATHNGQPTGAVATLMSTINQSWAPPMEGQDEMNLILTESSASSQARSFGGISMNGCMQMNDTYGSGGANMTDTWTCFGDPSVILRTQAPETMSVTYNPAIPVGSTSLDVTCSEEGALVSLTMDGEIIGTGIVSGGSSTVNFDAISTVGDITVTVTAVNAIPEIGTTSVVVLDGPWLVVTSMEFGGENGQASINSPQTPIYFTIENIGTAATSQAYVNASGSNGVIMLTYGDYIPSIGAGETYVYTDNYFVADVLNSAVDGEEAIINFTMESAEGEWASTMSLPISAHLLEITAVDANLSFGETSTALLTLTNNGSADFNGGSATLSADSDVVTFLSDLAIDTLAAGASVILEYELLLDADAPVNEQINFELLVAQGNFEESFTFDFLTPMCQASDLDIELTIMTDTYGSETSWSFTNEEGVVLASVDAGAYESNSTYTAAVCASEGSIMTFTIADTYGDGIFSPNGYWVTVCGNEVAHGDAFGSGTSHTFEVTCDVFVPVPGCMDPEADNYNPDANVNDDSCVYTIDCDNANALQLVMMDSYGDGWNGNYVIVSSIEGQELVNVTLEDGSEGIHDFCLEDGCYSIVTTNDGSWTSEVSWSLNNASGEVLATGTSPSSTSISLNTDCGFVNGCTDVNACNYNADANVEDGSCTYANTYYDCDGNCLSDVDGDGYCDELEVLGCTDAYAINYNADATEEDGSCVYVEDCELNFLVLNMNDSYGDGWNGNMLNVTNSSGDAVFSITLESGSEGTQTYCLENGCYVFTTTDEGGWPYEVSWTLLDASGAEMQTGEAPSSHIVNVNSQGCTIYGCTDPNASNYNPLATEDDGSCITDECICPEIWAPVCGSDGVNYSNACEAECAGVSYTEGECTDVVLGCTDETAINYNPDATEDDGSCEYETNCENGTLVSVSCDGGQWPTEVLWNIYDGETLVASGGAPYEDEVCLNDGICYSVQMHDSYGDTWNGNILTIGDNTFEGPENGCGYECFAEGFFSLDNSCDNGGDTEGPWDVLVTGSNHTLAVGGDTPVDIFGEPISNGDWLGVFYTDDNGELQCAGAMLWNGETYAIAAQGDDSTTDEVDGFQNGEEFTWIIWDASENVFHNANATYVESMPSQELFTVNGISGLASLSAAPAITEQIINLNGGWNMFSTYMMTEDMDIGVVLADILEDVIIVKNNEGSAYLVEWNFNGIGDMEVGQGYQAKMTNSVDLIVEGTYMSPEENPITLTEGWNMFGYLRTEPSDVMAVFEDLAAEVVIVKNGEGAAYLPEWNFNGIGDLMPGQGYQVKMLSTQVLTYLANDMSYRTLSTVVGQNDVKNFAQASITDNNMTVVIEDAAWDVVPTEGSEVAAFDKAGNMIGSAVYSSPVTVLTVWGDDATTEVKDGLAVAEAVSFKVWSNGVARDFEVAEWAEGSASYNVDAINVASSIVISAEVANTISSDRELVRVINVLGQEVDVNDDTFKGEVLFNVYKDGTVEKFVK
jgi:hypothetical protein